MRPIKASIRTWLYTYSNCVLYIAHRFVPLYAMTFCDILVFVLVWAAEVMVPTMLIFPYFLEPHVLHVLSSFRMLDFKVSILIMCYIAGDVLP